MAPAILEHESRSSRNSHVSGSSDRSSRHTVSEVLETMQVNVEKMLDRGVRYQQLDEEEQRRSKPAVPRICVGMVIVVVLILVIALIGLSVDWSVQNADDTNATVLTTTESWETDPTTDFTEPEDVTTEMPILN